ncbi:hypothetical protein [Streptomyces sp. NPDC058086]|uniref:hypothetical protein n=1 Tax=Streptomyces sp. NPDC058086 TaxID=3346334 RepID=UPI0036E0143A
MGLRRVARPARRTRSTEASVPSRLQGEAPAYGKGAVPHEEQRAEVIQARADEIGRRQRDGVLGERLDAGLPRPLSFAAVGCPRLVPQVTRMMTGLDADDPRVRQRWADVLRTVGGAVEERARERQGPARAGPPGAPRVSATSPKAPGPRRPAGRTSP